MLRRVLARATLRTRAERPNMVMRFLQRRCGDECVKVPMVCLSKRDFGVRSELFVSVRH